MQAHRAALRVMAQAQAATASFDQALRAGQAAQQALQAEVYFARCLDLRPANPASNVGYTKVTEELLGDFWGVVAKGESQWKKVRYFPGYYGHEPFYWPPYQVALPQIDHYLHLASAAYRTLLLEGHRPYLYDYVAILLSAKRVLPPAQATTYVAQAYTAVEEYKRRYGMDDVLHTCQQILAAEERRRVY